MRQAISVSILVVVGVLLNATYAAKMTAVGNWGEAIGSLFFGAIVLFYIIHSLIYFTVRLLSRSKAIAGYTASKLNYIACGITLLGILGAAVQRVTPPT